MRFLLRKSTEDFGFAGLMTIAALTFVNVSLGAAVTLAIMSVMLVGLGFFRRSFLE